MIWDGNFDKLWKTLDKKDLGSLSRTDLKQGLQNIDHPLWSANALSGEIFKAIDVENDGRISRQDFERYLQATSAKLHDLFESLPKEDDGRISKADLRRALEDSGIVVPGMRTDDFFKHVNSSQTGTISYEEWKDFLVFSPVAVGDLDDLFLSSYSRTLRTSHQGDVYISEDHLHQIGYFAAGGIASITSRTMTAPLDRLKIFLITQTETKSMPSDSSKAKSTFGTLARSLYHIKHSCKSLWSAGGVYSLWAGNGLNIVKMLPEGAIKFGVYEASRRFFAKVQGIDDPSKINAFAQLVSGGLGGIAAQFTAYPIDTLRFRMQCELVCGGVQGKQLLLQTAKKMWLSGGIRSYYRGLWWGLVGQFPYSALDLTTFNYAKQWLIRRNERQGLHGKDAKPGPVATAAIGGFSGAFGASMVWPLNMLRTRLQIQGTVIHPKTYTGIVDVTKQTLRHEGLQGLFRGIGPNLIKVVPAVSITYVVYEQSKQALGLD